MSSFKSDCIAFLIDADNVSADVIQQAFELVQMRHRHVHIRRAHCTAEAAVKHLELFKHLSIRPIVNMVTGKNCTDIALAVDAMEMAIIEKPDVVYIVSSDSDFAPLVIRLREKGCRVEGIGQKGKTGGASVGVYDDFVDIEHRKSASNVPHAGHAPSGRSAPAKRSRRGGGRNDSGGVNAAARRESPRDMPMPMPTRGEPRADARRDRPPPSRPMPRPEPIEEPLVHVEAPVEIEASPLPADPPPQIQLPLPSESPADAVIVEDVAPAAAKRGARAKAPARTTGRAPAKTPAAKRPRAAAKSAAAVEVAAVEPAEATPAPATPAAPPAPRPSAPSPAPSPSAPSAAPRPSPPPAAVAPAFVMPELVSIPGLPDEVAHILAVVPRLRDGETVELSVAGERLRAAGLLAKSASSTRLFGKYRDHFLLTPNGQPNKVRFKPPASDA